MISEFLFNVAKILDNYWYEWYFGYDEFSRGYIYSRLELLWFEKMTTEFMYGIVDLIWK